MKNRIKLLVKFGAASILVGFVLAFISASLVSFMFPQSFLDRIIFGLFFGSFSMFGLLAFYQAYREHKTLRPKQEKILFVLATQKNGILRISDAVEVLDVSKEQAEEILTGLVKQLDQQVYLQVDHNGELVYIFEKVKPNLRINKLTPEELAANKEINDLLSDMYPPDEAVISEDIIKSWK